MRRLKICLDQSIYEIYKRESTFYLISFKKMFLSLFEFSIISFKKMFCCLFSSFPRNSGKLFEKEILWNLLISVAKKSGKWEYLAIQNINKTFFPPESQEPSTGPMTLCSEGIWENINMLFYAFLMKGWSSIYFFLNIDKILTPTWEYRYCLK